MEKLQLNMALYGANELSFDEMIYTDGGINWCKIGKICGKIAACCLAIAIVALVLL
jgi:hypothetical protein